MTPWAPSNIIDFVRRWHLAQLTFSQRSYHQHHEKQSVYSHVQKWKGSTDGPHPTEWGWQKCDKGFVPIQIILPPAPEKLLQVIRCNCQVDCITLRCTCKKNNIECTPMYGKCRGSRHLMTRMEMMLCNVAVRAHTYRLL